MNNSLQKYITGDATPAEVLQSINIKLPIININEMINGIGRREVEKILNLIPAKKVIIEIDATWDSEEETLAGLMAGKYIQKIFIAGCNHEIRDLPQSTEEIVVRAGEDCAAIRNIVTRENIRKITMIGGSVDHRTWRTIADRTTKLSELELIETKLSDILNAHEALHMIGHFKTTNARINNREKTHEQVINQIYEQFFTRE